MTRRFDTRRAASKAPDTHGDSADAESGRGDKAGPGVALRKEHDARWGDVVKVARILISEEQRIL